MYQRARAQADSRKRLAHDSLFTGEDEVFAFRRALSRLNEMQSEDYLARSGPKRAGGEFFGSVAPSVVLPLQSRAVATASRV